MLARYLDNVTETHGHFRLEEEELSQRKMTEQGKAYAFDSVSEEEKMSQRLFMRSWGGVLVKTFYRSKHFDIPACCGDKIDDYAGPRIVGSDGRGYTEWDKACK